MYFLVRAVCDVELSRWWMPAAGIAYGVALFSKGLALLLAPAVFVFALVAVRRRGWTTRNVASQLILPAFAAIAVGGWWWARNYLLLGIVQPSQYGSRESTTGAFAGYSLGEFMRLLILRMSDTLWGAGANEETALPSLLVVPATMVVVTAAIVAVALAAASSHVDGGRWVPAALLSYPVLIMITISVNAHGIYWDLGLPSRGVQARYLFSGIAAAVVVAAVLLVVLRRRAPHVERVAMVLLPLLPAAAAAASAAWILPRSWVGLSAEFDVSPVDFMAFGPIGYAALVLGVISATIGLSVLASRLTPSDRSPGDSSTKLG